MSLPRTLERDPGRLAAFSVQSASPNRLAELGRIIGEKLKKLAPFRMRMGKAMGAELADLQERWHLLSDTCRELPANRQASAIPYLEGLLEDVERLEKRLETASHPLYDGEDRLKPAN